MSKELEALEEVNILIDYYGEESTTYDSWQVIIESLTPPTQEEVCKALSGWFDDTFYYDTNQREFYTKALNGQHSVVKLKNKELHFGGWYIMPPHVITLIGRFYEGEIK